MKPKKPKLYLCVMDKEINAMCLGDWIVILEVSIQILDSTTNEALFTCKAEGQGETEANALHQAITRCLQSL